MSIVYLVSAISNGNRFIYETSVPKEAVPFESVVADIVSGEYDAGKLHHVIKLDWFSGKTEDVTVAIEEAVREKVVASGKEPIPVVRDWINWIGIDPIVVRDGH